MNIRKWEIPYLDRDRAAEISQRCGVPYFLGILLETRGFHDKEELDRLLSAGEFSDPLLMKDMDKAVERIRRAIDDNEKIAVYGDYDADGVTSTAILYTYLDSVGADVIYYIPQREGEGYGMNVGAVRALSERGIKLIVTVDNGISSIEEVALANTLGVDVVITDHHRPRPELPEAVAIVDAYQPDDHSPFKDFSGAGVALKLLMAMEDGETENVADEYAELAALGTIGDVVPVVGENRTIIKTGIRNMQRSAGVGISALLNRCFNGRELTATSLSFSVIPRLNATGRMGSPERAVRLLCCEDEAEAQSLSDEICEENEKRREVEAEISREAIRIIENDPSLLYSRVIIVSGKGWHHGVIGIVAARITEKFGKPCFVIADDGEMAKGSGRSVEGFSLFEAVCSCADLFERYGGHPMAAGITLKAENIEAFRERINEFAKVNFPEMPSQSLRLDCRLKPAAITAEMAREQSLLEPFGTDNPQPLFEISGMEIAGISPFGAGRHIRLKCKKGGQTIYCVCFGMSPESFPYALGDRLDFAVSIDAREYRGEMRLTISIQDMWPSELDRDENIKSLRIYEKYRRGEALSADEAGLVTPTREDLAMLYRLIRELRGTGTGLLRMVRLLKNGFTVGKLSLGLDILQERGLCRFELDNDMVKVKLIKTEGKVDIFACPVFARIRELTA